jgi:hypothetical protein
VLQESADLVNWVNSTRAVNTVGGVSTVSVVGAGNCCFFRLGHP